MIKLKWIVLSVLAGVFIALFLLFPNNLFKAIPRSEPICAEISHDKDTQFCFFNMSAEDGINGYDLAFAFVNKRSMECFGLTQYNPDGTVSDHRIFTKLRFTNTEDNDSTVIKYGINLSGYGVLDGTIALGPDHASDFSADSICDRCKNTIPSICSEFDVVLMDLKEQMVYDICKFDYDYTFRKYHLKTSRNKDQTIKITIIDNDLQKMEPSS